MAARPCELLLLAANVNASAASYVTLTLEDSQGAPRSLNAQAVRLAAGGIERATVDDMSTLTGEDVASAAGLEADPVDAARRGLRRRRR